MRARRPVPTIAALRSRRFGFLCVVGALVSACGGEGAPAGEDIETAPAEPSATARHAARVRELYTRAGLPSPAGDAERLPICAVSVARAVDGWDLGVDCEGPAGGLLVAEREATTSPSEIRTCATHGKIDRAKELDAGGAPESRLARVRVSVLIRPGDAACPGLIAATELSLGIADVGAHLGGLPSLAHWHVTTTPPAGSVAVPFGIALPGPRPAVMAFRPASSGIAVHVAPSLALTELPAGDEGLLSAAAEPEAATAAALHRRLAGALDDLRTFTGPVEGRRGASALVVSPALAPGQVIDGAGGAFVGSDPADAAPTPDLSTLLGHVRNAEPSALIAVLLAHHPIRQDTVALGATAALVRDRLREGRPAGPFAEVFGAAAADIIALRLVRHRDGDKAARRLRELAVVWPLMRQLEGQEPHLSRLDAVTEPARLKAVLFLDALAARMGDEAGRELLLRTVARADTTPEAFRETVRGLAPVPAEAEEVVEAWLLAPDALAKAGPPSLGTLLEYVADGGAALLGRLALDEVGSNPALLKAAAGLAAGETEPLVPVLDLLQAPLEDLAGEDGKGAVGKLLDVGRLVLGGESARAETAARLVDELGGELGIDPAERGRLKMLADEVIRALHTPSTTAPPTAPEGGE